MAPYSAPAARVLDATWSLMPSIRMLLPRGFDPDAVEAYHVDICGTSRTRSYRSRLMTGIWWIRESPRRDLRALVRRARTSSSALPAFPFLASVTGLLLERNIHLQRLAETHEESRLRRRADPMRRAVTEYGPPTSRPLTRYRPSARERPCMEMPVARLVTTTSTPGSCLPSFVDDASRHRRCRGALRVGAAPRHSPECVQQSTRSG